jgi:hypothetical protein
MKWRILLPGLILLFLLNVTAQADTLLLQDGTTVEGIIKKVVKGQVVVEIGGEIKVFEILDIESMDFTTPHLVGGPEGIPIDHFLKDVEAQEIVENMEQLEKTSGDIEKLIVQIRKYWKAREPISSEEERSWEAAKETFRKPLSRYQELMNDLYFHVLAKVDKYNLLMKAASDIYVGVKGPFNVGSALVPKEVRQLPLKKYVPAAWYDTIFYDGYNLGFDDAYTKYTQSRQN